jgi:hypothetical protein
MRTLFVVSIYNYWREVEPVVRHFAANGAAVDVVLGWRGETEDAAIAALSALGVGVVRVPDAHAYPAQLAARAEAGAAAPAKRLPSGFARLSSLPARYKSQRAVLAWADGLFDAVAPDVVLQGPYHSCGTFDQAIAAVRRRRRVPAVCYPVSAYHGRNGAVRARSSNLVRGMISPLHDADADPINRLFRALKPRWIERRENRSIFMFDPLCLVLSRLSGLGVPDDVWQKPSVDFDRVCVFSEFSAGLLRESRYPMDRVRVVGIPLLDRVAAEAADPAARDAVLAELGLARDARFVLMNVEPSAEHHYADAPTHWRNFRATVAAVGAAGLPVVLSPHPLCDPADYAFAEAEFGVRIARRHKIYDLYPHCQAVVSFACSTNIVAEIFGKPLVIYDYFDLASETSPRRSEFRLPGARVCHDAAALTAALREALAALPTAPRARISGGASAAIFAAAADVARSGGRA